MTSLPLGRLVSRVTDNTVRHDFKLGLEGVDAGSGRLIDGVKGDYTGLGTTFVPGDVLFGRLRPYLAKVWVADRPGEAVGEFEVLRPGRQLEFRYAGYFLLSEAFLGPVVAAVNGAKMPRADWEIMRGVRIDLPQVEIQSSIADYLDRQTAQIDALIGKQQRLIETLRERRGALRTHVATRGLHAAAMTVSHLPWVGELPAHWPVAPLTSIARLESGHTPSRTRDDWWQDCYIPWISLHDVGAMRHARYLVSTAQTVSDDGIANSSARVLPAGTVVLSRDATVGRTAILGVPMATSQHFAAWVCGPRILPEYLWLLFSDAMQGHFNSFQNGSTIRTIGMGDLRKFKVPVPPLDEQRRIIEHLDAATSKIDTLIAKAEQFIVLARERRSALITAAVIGQIDVRAAS